MKKHIHKSNSFLMVLSLGLLFLTPLKFLTAQTPEDKDDKIVKVAVRAHSGVEAAKSKWTATIDYLSHSIEGFTFEIVPLVTFDEMREAVEHEEVQFVLTNPTAYIDLNFRYNVARIATLINGRNQNGFTEFGSVVFCRADRDDINTLNDVKGKSIMGVHQEAFGGWRMAYYELLEMGIDPFEDCSEVLFSPSRTQEGVVREVLKGSVDLGTVRTGILEKMAENGKINLQNIKIIEPKTDDFSLQHTTRLYPEWPFASLKNTDALLAKKTAIALLQMEKNNPAAVQGGYTGWEVPLGYNQVLLLLKALRVSPFEDYGKISLIDFLKLYWFWFLTALLTILGLVWVVIHISGLNKKLKEARSNLELKVEKRTAELNQANLKLHIENKISREAEEKLRISEERFRLAFQSNPDARVITHLQDGQIVEVNDAFTTIMGFGRDEVLGKTTPELDLWVNTEERDQFVGELQKTGSVQNHEVLLRTKSGKLINGLMSAAIISINKEAYIISMMRDITERKQAQEKIKSSEANLKALINNREDYIWSLDRDYRYIAFNSTYADMFYNHYKTECKTGLNSLDYLSEDEKEFWVGVCERAFTGEHVKFEYSYDLGKGMQYFQTSINPIIEEGEITGASMISVDITERKEAEEEIRLSRERLIRAQRIAKMGDFTWDVETGEVSWSDGLFDLLKYDKNENIDYAKVNAEIHHPEDLERVTQWLMDSVASGKDELPPNEYRIIRKDGETIYIRTEGVFDRSGGKTKLFATLYDITEQKKAMDEIKQYASIVAVSSDMMSMLDKNYRYVAVNDSYLKAFNLETSRTVGYTVTDLFGQEFFETSLKPQIDRCLKGEHINFQQWIEFPAHGKRFMDVNYYPYLDENGNITGVVVNARDITQQKKAEQVIRKKNESLAALLDVSYKITASLNKEIALQEIINNSVKLTNLDTGAIYSIEGNKVYMNAVTPSLPPDFPDEFRLANLDDHPHIRLSAKTGEPVLIPDVDKETLSPAEQIIVETRKMKSLLYIPLVLENRTMGVLILATQNRIRLFSEYEIDLYRTFAGQAALVIRNSELFKKAENSVEQLEQRVLERTAELQAANKELQEFAYSISHDLRAPLRSITGFSEIISTRHKQSLNEEGLRYFNFINEAGKNMAKLIEDLLYYTRLGIKTKEEIHLADIFNEVVRNMDADIRNLKAKISLPPTLPTIESSRSLLYQIFNNLIQNGLKYHRPQVPPEITVSVKQEKGKITIGVQDNGIGIAEKYQQKIFNIFQRLHSQDEYPGTGIGLAIVKKAVQKLDGQIQLESKPGKGSVFIVELPEK